MSDSIFWSIIGFGVGVSIGAYGAYHALKALGIEYMVRLMGQRFREVVENET